MMISPEVYYAEYLAGRTQEEILTQIRILKRRISFLKKEIEKNYLTGTIEMSPSYSTQLSYNQLYFERAKQALAEVGGQYKLTKAEIKAELFNKDISAIQTFKFSIGGFFRGSETHTVTVLDDSLQYTWNNYPQSSSDNLNLPSSPFMLKDEFLSAIKELNMGEWRHYYNSRRFGYIVEDGTQWEINITYNNGHKAVKFFGDNAYPYNFDAVKELFYIVDVEEGEE